MGGALQQPRVVYKFFSISLGPPLLPPTSTPTYEGRGCPLGPLGITRFQGVVDAVGRWAPPVVFYVLVGV